MRTISSMTARKSSPSALLKAPGTFAQMRYRGRIRLAGIRRCSYAFLISFAILVCSMNSPDRSPARPRRAPATDKSWQGEPPQMTSTGGSIAPFSFVISPTWSISGKRSFVTSMGKASISLAHNGVTPLRTAANGKPPIPSKRLPIVIISTYPLPSE